MTVVGEAFVAVSPISTGFGSKLEAQLAGSGFAGNVEKQMANAGILGGNAFTKKIQGALSAAGISGGAAFGAAVTLGAVAGLAKIGEEFQKAEHQIAQQTGATGKTLEGLADTVTRSFRQVPVSLGAAATAVDELFRRGVPLGPQLDQLAKQELFLAKVTKEDLGATVEATTGLMQKFNVPIADQSRELDVLFKAYQNSGKSLSELTSNLQKAGGVLQSFGFSLDKSAALLSALEKAGVNLGPALAGLRLAFGKIVSEGGDPQKVLASLIHEFSDGTPKAKAMADAIALFGKRSGAELSIAISKGKFDVDALLKSITDGKDGIIATGLATLTLGDQLKLFANNAAADLSKLGTVVLQGLERTFADLGPALLSLVKSFAQLVEAAAPLAVVFVPFVDALRVAGPIITVFATGVSTLSAGLSALPQPVLLAAAAIGTFRLVSLGAADGLIAGARALGPAIAGFAAAHPVLIAVAAGIATLGVVAKLSADFIDPAIAAAKDFRAAVFDAGNAAGVFKDGLNGTHQALTTYLQDQLTTNKLTKDVSAALVNARSSVTALSGAITGTAGQWDKYKQGLLDAAKAHSQFGPVSSETRRQVQLLSTDLDTQRNAFQLANKDVLTEAVTLGKISERAEIHIKNLHRSKDGTVDFGAAVDDLNKRLADQASAHDKVVLAADSTAIAEEKLTKAFAAGAVSEAEVTSKLKGIGLSAPEAAKQLTKIKDAAVALNQEQDRLATTVAPATAAYGELTREIARGTITQHDAELQLRAMKFSAAGASTAFGDLQSQVKSFIDGAVGKLPNVGTAIDEFQKGITDAGQQLADDQAQGVELSKKLNDSLVQGRGKLASDLAKINLTIQQDQAKLNSGLGTQSTIDKLARDQQRRAQILAGAGAASAKLEADVVANNKAIRDDFANLAADKNPNKFTEGLLANAAKIVSFTANLQTLVDAHLAPLAAELAKQGPESAAGLAAGLAAAPAKAIIAEKAVELGKTASDNFRKFLEDNAPELIGTGAKQGLVIGKAIADGITKELLNNFPFLRQIGITTGDELVGGAKEGAGKSAITDPILAEARKHIPEFRGLGVPMGTNVMDGVTAGVGGHQDVANIIASQIAHGGGKLREAGIGMGNALDEGVSAGIILNQFKVGDAIVTMTAYGTTVAANQWRIKSPSQAFAEIGKEIPAGIASGINANKGAVSGSFDTLDIHAIARKLAADGYNIGTDVILGVVQGIRDHTDNVSDAILILTQHGVGVAKNQWRISSPSAVFAEIGREVPAGLAQGIDANRAVVGHALDGLAVGVNFAHPLEWLTLGVAAAQGIADGIRSQFDNVANAILALTQHGVAVAKGAWKITSPSAVFASIGSEVGAGLAIGIASSSANVADATRGLALRATTSIEEALANVSVTPGVVKPIEVAAHIGPIATPDVAPVTIAASVRVPPDPVRVEGRVDATVQPIAPVRVDAVVSATIPPLPAPVVAPATITATVEPIDTVTVAGRVRATVLPIAPLSLAATVGATLAPIPAPTVAPVTIAGTVRLPADPVTVPGRLDVLVPPLAPVELDANVRPPVVAPVVVPASFGPLPTPSAPTVLVHGSFAPVSPPHLDPVTLSVSVPPVAPVRLSGSIDAHVATIAPVELTGSVEASVQPIDPLVLSARVGPIPTPHVPPVTVDGTVRLSAPRVPDVVVPATLSPLPTPSVAPVIVPSVLEPLAQPTIEPVVIGSSLAPPAPPTIEPVVIAAALSPIPPPRITPVVAPVSVPPLDPVVIDATLSPLVVPQPPTLSLDVAPLPPFPAPVIPPVVVSASLSPLAPPRIDPVVAPVVVPPIPQVTIPAALGTLVVPPLPQQHVNVAPLSLPPIPSPPSLVVDVAPVQVPALAPIPASLSVSMPDVGSELGRNIAAGVDGASTTVRPAVERLVGSVREPLGNIVDPSLTPGQNLAAGFADSFATIKDGATELREFLGSLDIGGAAFDQLQQQFSTVVDAKTAAGFVTFADSLVGTFHETVSKITVDAGTLQNVLDALTVQNTSEAERLSTDLLNKLVSTGVLTPKFAPPQPPSNVTFKHTFESLPVPRPQDRADAQVPRDAEPRIVFNNTFNEKIDPLHVASELAWQLL